MTHGHSHLSPSNPSLQVAWDSTSLGALQFCPRRYKYEHLDGWSGDQNDLQFGGYAASGFELYQKRRLAGDTKDQAQLAVVRFLLETTWHADGTQYGGSFVNEWRCTGTEKYKNAKGNTAKCPYSHKGVWFPEFSRPGATCGECGSPTEVARNYAPNDPAKNRQTLVRMLIWYIEEQPENLEDGLHPYVFPDGTPAVELSFRLPTPWKSRYGDEYLLVGHLDYIGVFGAEMFSVDNKTTTKTLGASFWQGYSPHYQMDTYDLTGSLLFPDLPISGVLIDAAQTMVSGARFARHPIYKTEAQREEHWQEIEYWIKQAEDFAAKGHWPMNKRNCWLCPFAGVCNKDPATRERILAEKFTKRELWNPLVPRV